MINKTIISFSFDDGRIDNYTVAYPLLKKYEIPATFNITTGYIERKIEVGQLTHVLPMSIEMVKELYDDPNCEISGHGYWHKNDLEDIVNGIECLGRDLEVVPFGDSIGFASPGTSLDLDYYQTLKKEFKKHGIAYIRLSKRYISNRFLKVMARKLSRILHLPFLFSYAYKDVLMDNVKDNLLYSAPILASTTINEVKALINRAIQEKKALILMWHSIVNEDEIKDNFDYDVLKFERICQWLNEKQKGGELIMAKTIDLYKELSK